MSTTTRQALGRRSVELGQLYDARTDSLLAGYSIFTQSIPADLIKKLNISNSTTEFSMGDTLMQKFENMKIDGQLKASFMAGLLKVEGSSRSLSEPCSPVTKYYKHKTEFTFSKVPQTINRSFSNFDP